MISHQLQRLVLVGLLFLVACNAPAPPGPASAPSSPPPVRPPVTPPPPETPPVWSPVDSVLAGLDDRALVGQLLVVYRVENAYLLNRGFGGVLLFRNMLKDPEALRDELAALQAVAPIPYLVALDQEGGAVSRIDALPNRDAGTPGAAEMGAWPAARIRAEGRRIGTVLAGLGVNLNLAPVLDPGLAWDGAEGWMGRRGRAFGHDDSTIVRGAAAFARGCAEVGVACLAKHFPGYDVAENSDVEPAVSRAPAAAVRRNAARFTAVSPVVAGVMMTSIIYPMHGPEPAVLNPALVAMARDRFPTGVIMTDDLWAASLRHWQRPDLASDAGLPDQDWFALGERALRAGNDLLLITYPAKASLLQGWLARRLAEDPTLRTQVAASVRRVLQLKADLGLLGDETLPRN